jgi:flavin reductase (DIM6/NTAB) family NADH-FMN oxidoreductase RutF
VADPVNDGGPLTPAEWRGALGYFPSGVTIVTTWDAGAPVGSTVSSFCSVSLEPPLLLICLDHRNPILAPLTQCLVFGVNILPEDGAALARRFAAEPQTDRFRDFAYRAAAGGAPQLAVAPVFIDCGLESAHEAGDHTIVVGRGLRIDHTSPVPPLLYHRGAFPRLSAP